MMVENDIRICKNFKIYSLIFLNKRDQEDPQIEMQPRDIRIKNIAYMSIYLIFSVSMISFIMYRTKGRN